MCGQVKSHGWKSRFRKVPLDFVEIVQKCAKMEIWVHRRLLVMTKNFEWYCFCLNTVFKYKLLVTSWGRPIQTRLDQGLEKFWVNLDRSGLDWFQVIIWGKNLTISGGIFWKGNCGFVGYFSLHNSSNSDSMFRQRTATIATLLTRIFYYCSLSKPRCTCETVI